MNQLTCLLKQPHSKTTAVANLRTGIVRERKMMVQKAGALVTVLLLVNLFFINSAAAQSITVTNVSPSPVCAGSNVTVTFDATNGVDETDWYNNSTVYTIYLSNSSGASFTSQGTFSTTGVSYAASGGATTTGITAVFIIPGATPAGTGYKIALGSSAPAYNNAAGNNASPAFSVVTTPVFTPTVSIAASPSGPVCAGSPVTFTATASGAGGGTINYDFKVNGGSVQSSASNTYTSTSLTNGNTVTCEITVTGGCLTTNTATSNTITMTVNSLPICAISGPAGPVCPSSGGIVYTYAAPVMSSYSWSISGNGSISGSNSGSSVTVVAGPACNLSYTLTLTITNANGCQSVCSKTVMVAAPTLTVNCPADMTEGACFNQSAIDAAFAAWKSQFGFTGGCNTTGTDLSIYTAPPACGGSVTITYVAFDLCGQVQSCTKTFTVQAPPARIVNVPPVSNTSACMYPSQAAANAAFAAWLQLFSVNGGCNPSFSTLPSIPTAPNLCGGSTTVTWTVTDYCGTTSTHSSTFTIDAAAPVVVTPVSNSTTSACIYPSQTAADAAFASWLGGFSVSGGCSPTFITSPVTPVAPNVCGGSTTVTWTVTDHCYTTSTHSATFTITPAPAVTVTPVSNSITSACIYPSQTAADAAFSAWLSGFAVSGGCSPTFTTSPVTPVAPNFCGGSTTVTWTVTDHCYTTTTHSATFTITPAPAVTVTPVSNSITSACIYADQAAANAAFASWLGGFGVSGGCSPTFTTLPVTPTAPNFCGGSTTVTWTVTDHCYTTTTHTATFTITAPATVNVTPVTNSITSACIYPSQTAADAAFSAWLSGFAVSGGCSPTFTTSPVTPTAPNFCGGSTTVTWTVTDHCYTTTTHTATFTITAPATVNVTPVTSSTTSACIYPSQTAADAAFSAWLSGFSVSGGCSPTFSTLPSAPIAPNYCGGSTTVTWTVTDHCYTTTTHSATFTITAPATVNVTPVTSSTTSACIYPSQTAADAAFASWLGGFSVSGGCSPTFSTLPSIPTAPDFCGGSTTVTWTVTDHCYTTSTHSATFTITPAPAVTVIPVTNSTTSACIYASQTAADAAFSSWLSGFGVSGGCSPTFSTLPSTPTAPNYCGGSTTVTWTVTDHCYTTSTHSATFIITAPPAVTVTPVTNSTTSACIYASQTAADAAFSSWLSGFGVSGGCSPTFSTLPSAPIAPNYCGGATTVTWTVTDRCYTSTHTATFTITAPPAVNVTAVTNFSTSPCTYTSQTAADAAFASWLTGFSVSGGCSPTFSYLPSTPTAPPVCGGSTTVTWTVTDHCYTTSTHTATFTIQPNTAPVITGSLTQTVLLGCSSLTPPAATTVAQLETMGILVTDDCTADANLTVTSSDVVTGTCPRLLTRTYTITDPCNNSSTVVHLIYFKIPVLADPALVDVNITDLSDVLLNANLLPLNSVNRVHVPILNLDQDPAHIVPSGTTKIRLDLGDKMILDPSFNLATAPLSAFFTWTKVVESGHDVIYGDQIADLSHNFVGDAYFQTIAVTPGTSRDTATFQVTNHNNPSYFLIDVVTINNATGLKYVVLDAFTVTFDSKTDVTCFGGNDGSITVHSNGGAAPYQYSVDGGTTWLPAGGTAAPYTISGLTAGTYTVMAKDFVSQVITLVPNVTISQPVILSATVASTNVTCFGASNGTITISSPAGGYGTYEYSINGGGAWQTSGNFTGLAPGFYNVQIRDAAHTGCVIILNAALEITGPAVLNATVTSTNVTCNSAADGTITVSAATGGYGTYEYRLDAGTWQTSGSFTGLAPAAYSVQIRDAAYPACFITLTTVTITEPPVLNAAVTAITHVACAGNSTGAVTVTATGGTPGYEYSLDAGAYQVSGTFTGLAAGPHSVTAKDANGCLKLVNFTINEAANPDLTLGSVFDNNIFFSNGDQITVVYNIAEIKGKAATPARLRIFKPAGYNVLFNNTLTSSLSLTVDNPKWQLTTSNSLYYEFSRTGPGGNNTINCNELVRISFTVQRATFNVSTFNLNAVVILATGEIIAVNNSNSILLVGE